MARNRYDMDEILEDSFDVNQLKRLAGYIAPYKKKMAGVILLMLSSSALTMAIPIFFQNVMDHSIPEKDMKSITFYSIADRTLFGYFPADQDQDHECDRAEYRT